MICIRDTRVENGFGISETVFGFSVGFIGIGIFQKQYRLLEF
jgi:hypothetical protein